MEENIHPTSGLRMGVKPRETENTKAFILGHIEIGGKAKKVPFT